MLTNRRIPLRMLLVVALSVSFCTARIGAGEWPMWRCDATRSAASDETLPEALHLQWTRRLPPPQPAWPNEPRLQFDASYEPIVLGRQMFVGSPRDGSVTAWDTATGQENWRFYTNGPVRLAPVGWQGKVIFGSDDGHLYCLDAAKGSLVWKVRGAPADRREYRHLGNGRLVSFWPVRGGPVLADGVIYFGAGIWPSLGVFLHAVDARTGKVLWTNANSHYLQNVRIDHNRLRDAGLSPQGHLLVVGDLLVVPNGRSMPARLNRHTGELLYFVQGYRNGDSRVIANGDLALVGENGVLNLRDGREVSSRWASAGKEAPQDWSSRIDLFEGPIFPYKFLPACSHRSALCDHVAYGMDGGVIYAHDLSQAALSLYDQKYQEQVLQPARWEAPLLWKFASDKKQPCRTLIKAGPRLYAGAGKSLLAIDLPGEQRPAASLAWSKELDSEPASILAADGRLFVAASDGRLHCFGAEPVEPQVFRLPTPPASDQRDGPQSPPGVRIPPDVGGGYAVVLGLADGRLVEWLLRQTDLRVIVVDGDAHRVNALRRRWATEGPYASRFQAIVGDPSEAGLPPFVASLVVSEDAGALDLSPAAAIQRVYGILRPYGGTACLAATAAQHQTIAQTPLPNAEVQYQDGTLSWRRVGPLPGAAAWTHETADAARTFYSKDELVRAPLGVLWYGDGPDHGFYTDKDYEHGVKPQVAGGRLFALQIATRTLHAVDVFTGRLLWVRKVGPSARYASLPEAIYVAGGRQCEVLDPATGNPQKTFTIDVGQPPETPASVSDIRVAENVILAAFRFNNEDWIHKGRWDSTLLVALDRDSGTQLWSRVAEHRYNTAAIALAGGRAFCIDSQAPTEVTALRRRGETTLLPSTIMALDARTGALLWKTVANNPPVDFGELHFGTLRTYDDWLSYSAEQNVLLAGKGSQTLALDASTGSEVWNKAIAAIQPLIVTPETFINQAGHIYEIRTGRVVNDQGFFQHGGCNYAVGGKNLIFVRDYFATYVDLVSRQRYSLRNLRSGCSNSLVAADGLLNAPCFSAGCVCNYSLQTSFAMLHMPEVAAWQGDAPLRLDPSR